MSDARVTAWIGSEQAFPAAREVEIVALPYVDRPLWVAKSWIGLRLSVASDVQEIETKKMGRAPKSRARWFLAKLFGQTETVRGYLINVKQAVEVLAEKDPEAARWWRENQPALLDGKSCIVFRESACRSVGFQLPASANDGAPV